MVQVIFEVKTFLLLEGLWGRGRFSVDVTV